MLGASLVWETTSLRHKRARFTVVCAGTACLLPSVCSVSWPSSLVVLGNGWAEGWLASQRPSLRRRGFHDAIVSSLGFDFGGGDGVPTEELRESGVIYLRPYIWEHSEQLFKSGVIIHFLMLLYILGGI